ncbi:MAG: Dabb family protein, partial [Oscillospiraceae bacterium]|nr:Dabb family protein [Oscillospiraceae bacterium]
PGTGAEQEKFLSGLRGLMGVIPQIREQEVGVNKGENNYDAVLVSLFDTMEDLAAYQVDPRHVAVASICKEIRVDRVAVDYEV